MMAWFWARIAYFCDDLLAGIAFRWEHWSGDFTARAIWKQKIYHQLHRTISFSHRRQGLWLGVLKGYLHGNRARILSIFSWVSILQCLWNGGQGFSEQRLSVLVWWAFWCCPWYWMVWGYRAFVWAFDLAGSIYVVGSNRSCHVITRDELYDLCLRDWVGFGHLASEYILKNILFLSISPMLSACHRGWDDYELNEDWSWSSSSIWFGGQVQ